MKKKNPEELHEQVAEHSAKIFDISSDKADNDEIRDRLYSGGKVTGTNLLVMICAIIIASVGLNTGSTAIIIGAMLISPLMGSILALAYSTVSADSQSASQYLKGLTFQVLFSILASTIYFLLSPIKEPTAEILARTNPSFYDVLVAFFGGLAGIVGMTRKDKTGNVIPGVAIATAIMPPLCTCGYAIANGEWAMLGNAFYLFFLNAYFIYGSASLILTALQIPRVRELTEEEWRRRRFQMIRNTIFVLLPCILMTGTLKLV